MPYKDINKRKLYAKEYYHQLKNLEKARLHYWNNRDKINKRRQMLRKNNPILKKKSYIQCKIWRENNSEKHNQLNRKSYNKNRKQIAVRRKIKYRLNYKQERNYRNNYHKIRSKKDKNYMIIKRLRRLLHLSLKNYGKRKNKPSKKYGIEFYKIIEHLKPFPEDLSKYHIDHIRPLCSFTFINEDGSENLQQIQEAFKPENHQWLLAEENLRKGGRFNFVLQNETFK
jgi:hypothetical protein